jgi:hypothetical protein
VEATLTGASQHAENRRFYTWTAAVFVLIAFGGFTPTYWAPVLNGTFQAPPILHVHGFLLFSWTLFYLVQTTFVASGRIKSHRSWGLFGIALFTALVCSIIATKITIMRLDTAHGMGPAGRRFAAVAFLALPMMIGLFATAIANIHRPEIHKRLMYTLMASLMTPAIARVFITVLVPGGAASSGPPPVFVAIPPALVAFLMIIVAIIHDWRTRGRPHKAYIYGGLVFLLETGLELPVSNTQEWMSIATALEHLPG